MIENTKCYSASISSYFGGHAGITINISPNEKRFLMLDKASMKDDPGIFGCLYTEKAAFQAIRQGMTASVFIKDDGHPMLSPIVAISPNFR